MDRIQSLIIGITVPPIAFGFYNLGTVMVEDLEVFYVGIFDKQIKTIKWAKNLLVISTTILAVRYLFEAILKDFFSGLIEKSMKSESVGYEIYLMTITLASEVFTYIALIYTTYWRKSHHGWVKM